MKRAVAFLALGLVLAGPAYAVLPSEQLANPKLEARARAISKELRCVVCQNETIDESDAPLAHDLRVLLRQRLKAGDTDQQAIDYIVARYGSFVLLKPPVRPETWLLWFGPLLVLVIGGIGAGGYLFHRRGAESLAPAALTAEEETKLRTLLKAEDT